MTSPSEHKEIVRLEVERAWNEGDLEVIDDLFAADSLDHVPLVPMEIRGPEGHKQLINAFRSTFPDLEVTIHEMIAEGDLVAHRVIIRGTHDGDFVGIDPAGEEIEVAGLVLVRFEDGKIAESWANFDALGILQQIGKGVSIGDLQTKSAFF